MSKKFHHTIFAKNFVICKLTYLHFANVLIYLLSEEIQPRIED